AEQFSGLLRTHLHLRALLCVGPAPTEGEIDAVATAAVETFPAAYAPHEDVEGVHAVPTPANDRVAATASSRSGSGGIAKRSRGRPIGSQKTQ
ncbi:MAG: TetR/AcrR family transcriptional regulator C-terminal domain-containing protein, partial [Acetobacteraceae bacterium]